MASDQQVTTTIQTNALQESFMNRCIQLAQEGSGSTAPNPMVGAVLVHGDRIIGEGYHKIFGQAHAEVNCIKSVAEADRSLIPESTLYVSLEPCNHFGKTPPCTDLILREKIPCVIIGTRDPFPLVNGKGIEKLIQQGVRVEYPVLEEKSMDLNKRFFCFHQKKRPYIILKWAESGNHKIGSVSGNPIKISNEYSDRLVHKWRSEESGILVGTKTAMADNPSLTNRHWTGKSPTRIVLDKDLSLPETLKLFDGSVPTIVINQKKNSRAGQIIFKQTDSTKISNILSSLYDLNILSVLVEGGAKTIQSFIDSGEWDEARIITNRSMEISNGIAAPELTGGRLFKMATHGTDVISWYIKTGNEYVASF